MDKPKVAVIKGGSHYQNIVDVLELKKNGLLIIGVILFLIIISSACVMVQKNEKLPLEQGRQDSSKLEDLPIRQPAVAGSFYPADPEELKSMVEEFLAKVEVERATGTPRIIIVPHAGYVFSGQVAAYSYKTVQGKDYDEVVLIGPSHTTYLTSVSVFPRGYYETPLGQVKIDEDLATRISASSERISSISEAHVEEHDLEVQLPFLQVALNKNTKTQKHENIKAGHFKIVPILVSQDSEGNVEALVRAVKDNIDDKTLIVISSDLSHYPEYEVANEVDNKVVEAILTKDTNELDKVIKESMSQGYPGLDTCACGEAAIKVGMLLAKELELEGKLLKYANSGDVSGDHSRVVGYTSVVFSEARRSDTRSEAEGVSTEDEISQEDKQRLLKITRETLEEYLSTRKIPRVEVESDALQEKLGAFVTLRTKQGQLRGCIGRFSPTDIPLYEVVQRMAIAAATEDIRFTPVSREELDDLKIEVSVLSNLTKIDDWHQIEVGKHGVEVVQGMRKGVFLPQVATENNWDLETFMNELCESKAGISRDAWKTGRADLYVFTAEVFGEK